MRGGGAPSSHAADAKFCCAKSQFARFPRNVSMYFGRALRKSM